MAVVLDTAAVAARQRSRVMAQWFDAQCGAPTRVESRHDPTQMVHRLTSWRLGPLTAAQSRGTAMRIVRGSREVRLTEHPQLLISYFAAGTAVGTSVTGGDFHRRPGDLLLQDLSRQFVMDWSDDHELWGLEISLRDLDVPEQVLHRALGEPLTSPVLPALQRHIARLCAVLPAVDGTAAAEVLGQLTVDLARAALTTAGAPPTRARDALEESLVLRVEQYLLERLHDPALSGAEVAAAHFVSLRRLYYAWASEHEESLASWLMFRRLERAARRITHSRDSISSIAHRCGFADAAHFSRRFRAQYGWAPREWRALTVTDGQPGTPTATTPPAAPLRPWEPQM